jgi:hypothetical protein
MYYLTDTNLFYKYDTVMDCWMALQSPNIAALNVSTMRYSYHGGTRGRVIATSANTVTIPGLNAGSIIGKTIRITEGTGVGQERTILSATSPDIVEYGVVSTGAAASIQDLQTAASTKRWKINQWRGYQCRIVASTGQSQLRKIIYNDANTLFFNNPDLQGHEHWTNTGFSSITPYAVPAAGSHYYIEKVVATVSIDWKTVPDATSKFLIKTGAVWLMSGRTAANGVISVQYYSVAENTWFTKTCPGGMITAATAGLVGDLSLERCGESGGVFETGTCDNSSGSRTMVDLSKSWTRDQWVGFSIEVINSTTEERQESTVIGNTETTLYIDDTQWETTPTSNYTYTITGNRSNIWVTGHNSASIYKYLIDQDLWADSWHYDNGVSCNMSLRYGKQLPYSYTATMNTAAINSVASSPTNGGSGYKVGDISSINEATGGKVRVTAVSSTGVVTALELYACGTAGTYTTGIGKATTAVLPSSGGGTGLTVNITAVGRAARVTTATAHNLKVGDVVAAKGSSIAAWNTDLTVGYCDSVTAFDITNLPDINAPTVEALNSTALLVDASKNWTVNEHAGKIVHIYATSTSGIIPTSQTVKIQSNTARTLSFVSVITSAAVTGTSRYLIKDQRAFGSDFQDKISNRSNIGWAVSAGSSTTTLSTNNRVWIPNQWAGYKLRVLCGTGYDKGEVAITANDETTLSSAAWGFTPNGTTKYEIMDSFGIATGTLAATTLADSTKNWGINQWAGKPLRIVAGAQQTQEVIIASNTATTLTFATLAGATTATTCYSILGAPVRAIGHQIIWNSGQSGPDKGKYLYVPRGGTSTTVGNIVIDRYDINTNRWDYCLYLPPDGQQQTLGTYWAYDNHDIIYYHVGGRTYSINLSTKEVNGSGQIPYGHGTAIQGNRMEVLETIDGLKFLYIMRHAGSEFWRTLLI